MANSKYLKRYAFYNTDSLYQQKFKDKGVDKIKQLSVPNFVYPTVEQIQKLDRTTHIWKQGDSFEKLAFSYYGDMDFWWIIPLYNNKPTEQHFSVGDSLYIPQPLYKILSALGY